MNLVVTRVVLLAAMCAMSSSGQVRIAPGIAENLLAEKSDPVYPALAKQTKTQGTVKIDITVSETGAVVSTKLIGGHPLLVTAAIDAVKKRKYTPYMAGGKATSFVTTVEIPFSVGIPKDEYDRQQAVSDRYFKLEDKCRGLLQASKWEDAEQACRDALPLAQQLGDHQGLTKMGAYEHVGYALLGQQRYGDALEYYSRAFEFAQSSLKETDAELGYAYRNLAMANHGLRNLDKARELYRKAEAILQLAHENIDSADLKQRYETALKEILKYHLLAAEEAGDSAEVQDIKKRLETKP
ncbi:MAG: TonB family protein [Acidobacteriia bacterium]|nr:TonB family protein [Terriglobia bacterium]